MTESFYIQSKGYIGNSLIWWKKGSNGYTAKLDDALIVSRANAEDICRNRPGEDTMWPVSVIDAIASRQVDSQDLAKAKAGAA